MRKALKRGGLLLIATGVLALAYHVGNLNSPSIPYEPTPYEAADLAAPNVDVARIRPLLAMEADRARDCYLAGEELIPLVNEDSQPALWVLITIYRRLLEKIASNQYDVFRERVRLTVREKLTVLGKGILKRLV